jgi:hypothetical protein
MKSIFLTGKQVLPPWSGRTRVRFHDCVGLWHSLHELFAHRGLEGRGDPDMVERVIVDPCGTFLVPSERDGCENY